LSQNRTQNRLMLNKDYFLKTIEITYKENYPKMYRLAMKMVHDEAVASDIIQEVFVYYFEKTQNTVGATFTVAQKLNIKNTPAWLARATMNKCVDYLRHRDKFTPLNVMDNATFEEKPFEIQKTETLLKQAISKLKPLEIKIVILYSEEYSYKEIAKIAEINFSSVGKTLSRTLQKLKEILKTMNYEMY